MKKRRLRSRSCRGFSLVELMVVIVIVGVLATIGITLFRKQIFSSRAVEAIAMMQSIRAAQERWRAEHHGYLDVSTTMDATYPMAVPGKTLYNWDQPAGADYPKWRLLAPTVSGPVQFGYAVKAGAPFTALAAPTSLGKPVFPAAAQVTEPWYVIQSKGDTDGDGVEFSYYVATSFSGEIYRENQGE